MTEESRKIIVDAKVSSNFIEASKDIAYWRDEMKKAQEQGDEYKGDIIKVAQELAKANNRFREAKKVIESTAQAEEVLNSATDDTVKTLGEMQRELTALRNVPLDVLSEEQASTVKQRMAELMASISDVKAEIKGMDTGAIWENTTASLQFITAGTQVVAQTFNALGVDSEQVDKLRDSTIQLIGATQALSTITGLLGQKKLKQLSVNIKTIAANAAEAVSLKAVELRTKSAALAEDKLSVAKIKGGIASKAAAAAAWLLNAALAVNPIVLALAAIVALGAGLWGLSKAFGGSAQAARDAETAMKQFEKQAILSDEAIEQIARNREAAIHDATMAGRREIADLKKNGATQEQIARAEYEMNRKIREEEYKGLIRNRGEYWNRIKDIEASINTLERSKQKVKEGSDEWVKIDEKINSARNSLQEFNNLYAATGRSIEKNIQDQADAELANDKRLSDATYNRLLKQLELQKNADMARIKAESGYQSEDFAMKQSYARRLYELQAASEQKSLQLQRQSGTLSESEYRTRLEVLANARREFDNQQAKEANAYYKQQREAILGLFDKNTEERIAEVNRKFEKAYEQLRAMGEKDEPDPSAYAGGESDEQYQKDFNEYREFMFNRAVLEMRMQQQQERELKEIRRTALRERAEEIEKAISEEYENDLRKYQTNERRKLEIMLESLEKQKQAKEKEGLDTYDEDAQILDTTRKLNQLALDADLLAAGENAKAKYDLRVKWAERERELAEGNAQRLAEIDQAEGEAYREMIEARIAEVEKWANASMELMSGVNDLFNALGEAQVQKAEEKHAKESELLQEQLDNGLISQKEYDKKQEQLDKNLEKEQAKIARQQAIREKAMAMFKIAIDTATAIMGLWANPGFPAAIPLSVTVGALGAIQLAAVAAQPLPKAARGRYIKGKSHAQGGELVVAEDGEIIMNKNSVRMFGPALSAMSVAGGGVPFPTHIPDGGYTARYAMSSYAAADEIGDAVGKAMKKVKIYTTVEDIRRGERAYTIVEGRGEV